jgi:hypothetical protein
MSPMFKKFLRILPLAIAPVIALTLGGCGKKVSDVVADKVAEKAIEKQTGGKAKVDTAGGKMEFTTAKGEKVEVNTKGGAKLPDGFPKDVYVYAGAAVNQSMKVEGSFHLMMESADAKSKVVDTYKSKLEADGWKQTTFADSGDTTMLQYSKGKRTVMLTVSESDKKTQMNLMVSSEEAAK